MKKTEREAIMNNGFQKKMYEMEVAPPPLVWERLSSSLDEINADNLFAKKIYGAERVPPKNAWEKIKESLRENDIAGNEKKVIQLNFKKLIAAAIVTGMIASAWFLFFNPGKKNETPALAETSPIQEKQTPPEQNITAQADAENKNQLPVPKIISKKNFNAKNNGDNTVQSSSIPAKNPVQYAVATVNNSASLEKEKTRGKVFDQPIDDLSMVATDDNYMTMVNTNGRMVKIPAHLAHLAPRLQNKPITEDYFELMFGEAACWKDQLNEWRQKLATAPIAPGDIFSTMVELLKSVQEK